jgi:transcriptional regulator with XRE-family HTH domain
MQKGKTVSKLLGLKQEELAMLLNISKGQLAMFETGKRDLPIAAMQQLAPMLQFVQEESLKSGSAEVLKFQTEQKKKVLAQLLKDNQYKQKLLEKKLEIVVNKYQANSTAMQLMRFLEIDASKKGDSPNGLVKLIEARAASELKKNSWEVVTKLQMQKEVLLAEEKMLLRFTIWDLGFEIYDLRFGIYDQDCECLCVRCFQHDKLNA